MHWLLYFLALWLGGGVVGTLLGAVLQIAYGFLLRLLPAYRRGEYRPSANFLRDMMTFGQEMTVGIIWGLASHYQYPAADHWATVALPILAMFSIHPANTKRFFSDEKFVAGLFVLVVPFIVGFLIVGLAFGHIP